MANATTAKYTENRREEVGKRRRLFMSALDLAILNIIRNTPGISASEAALRLPNRHYRVNQRTGKKYAASKNIYRCKVLRERGYLKKGKPYKTADAVLYPRIPLFITKAGERVLDQHKEDMFGAA